MSYLGTVDMNDANIKHYSLTGSTLTTVNIGWTPASEQSLRVTINGVVQQGDTFSYSGSNLTLGGPLVATDTLEVVGIQSVGNIITPADNSVTTAKLADDAVTLAKMAGGTDGNLITYDASGDPAHVVTGSATHVLTSNGAGAAPTFQAVAAAGADTSLSNLVAAGADKIIKGWACWDGDPLAIRDSFNVSSITDISVGVWEVNWDTDFSNASYAVVAGGSASSGGGDYIQTQNSELTTAKFRTYAYTSGGGTTWDPNYVSVVAIGDQ